MSRTIPAPAAWLGGAGVVPFVAAALCAVIVDDPDQRALALRAFTAYSAIILSFLGGVRWGAALSEAAWRPLMAAVAPSLFALVCLLLPAREAIIGLALAFAGMGVLDVVRRPAPEWPAWFMKLRARLSGAVVVVHIALLAALAGHS